MASLQYREENIRSCKTCKGGGLRRKKFDKNTKLNILKEEATNIYFPSGKSSKGFLFSMDVKLCSPMLHEINSLEITIHEYISEHAIRTCKVVLMSRDGYLRPDSDSDDDFLIPALNPKQSTPKTT